MYSGVFGLSKRVKAQLNELEKIVNDQIDLAEGLYELDG